ncbi:chitosanase [Kitasatospora cinereorecta]|uniref:Chitosanase n=1 Tax=Kitasatospora cinereorecta TaxID=285560 RepID=A0ABW0VCA6_9ACTN
MRHRRLAARARARARRRRRRRVAVVAVLVAGCVTAAVGVARLHGGAPDAAASTGRPADPDPGTTDPAAAGAPAEATPAPATPTASSVPAAPSSTRPASPDLDSPRLKEIAQELVSSAENSSLDWKAQYTYIEDIQDGRGYTGGIIGFTSATDDMLRLVKHYQSLEPDNPLVRYLPALQQVNGSDSHQGLDPGFTADWHTAAQDPAFRRAQDDERDRVYFNPAVAQAKADGLRALGQFAYYDAMVMHGPGSGPKSFAGIRAAALAKAKPPAQGGDETAYLEAFLSVRRAVMKSDPSRQDTSRIDTIQEVFLKAGNLTLATPLKWTIYGDSYAVAR